MKAVIFVKAPQFDLCRRWVASRLHAVRGIALPAASAIERARRPPHHSR